MSTNQEIIFINKEQESMSIANSNKFTFLRNEENEEISKLFLKFS
jgi:hypothetical protein